MTTTRYNCQNCNKEFIRYDKRSSRKFCSLDCYNQFRHKNPAPHNCTCKVCGKTFHLKASSLKQGMGIYCSRQCKHYAQRQAAEITGESYNDRHLLRQSTQYRVWRRNALKLHDLKCDHCGIGQHSMCECCGNTIYLNVHHLEKFSSNVEKRFDPNNSSVLCAKCHRAIENNTG